MLARMARGRRPAARGGERLRVRRDQRARGARGGAAADCLDPVTARRGGAAGVGAHGAGARRDVHQPGGLPVDDRRAAGRYRAHAADRPPRLHSPPRGSRRPASATPRGRSPPAIRAAPARGRSAPTCRPSASSVPGQGSQYPRMGFGLYRSEPAFRDAYDECCAIVEAHTGVDPRARLLRRGSPGAGADQPSPSRPSSASSTRSRGCG